MTGFLYKSYNFTEKDPIIDEIRTIVQQHGVTFKQIHEDSGVSAGTLTNWFSGPTKKPQSATINAVLRSMGWKLAPVPINTRAFVQPTLPTPQEAAKASLPRINTRHVVQMSKYKRDKGG